MTTKPEQSKPTGLLKRTCWIAAVGVAALVSVGTIGYFSSPAPIFSACHSGNTTQVIEILTDIAIDEVSHKIDAEKVAGMTDSWGNSVLHWAARGGASDTLKVLVESVGLNPINARNNHGSSVLHWASLAPQESCGVVAQDLVSWGVPPDARNADNETALHWAVLWEKPTVVSVLLSAGADPNAQDSTGASPMHLVNLGPCRQVAATTETQESKVGPECGLSATILELLMSNGGDVHLKDAEGRSFYDNVVSHLTRQSKESGGDLAKLMEKLQSGNLHGSASRWDENESGGSE